MTKWIIDPDHSVAAFSIRHLMIANVHGQFNMISGAVSFDVEDPTTFSLDAVIDTAGIYTGIGKRDDHLRSPDFFDAASFPNITFHSTSFKVIGPQKGKLTGQLTIHGITRPAILDTVIAGPVISPEEIGGETTIGISSTTRVNREVFGMIWNLPLAGGDVMVGREVEISLNIEADLEE